MLTPTEAEALILASIPPMPTEDVPLAEAHGRVLRANLRADRDLPPFDRVMLDGYALRAAAWAAGTQTFRVTGLQAAGMIPQKLAAGDTCIEIATGAALPEGADCVVPYEDTTRDGETMKISAAAKLAPGHAVHRCGSDYAAGTVIVSAGTRLTGREIAVAAACGCAALAVNSQPKIAVIVTGDELVDVGAEVGPHQLRRSNDYALRAALHAAGWLRVERFHLHDMRHEIEHTLWHILAEFDVVLLTGGVSKGKFDFLPAVLAELGVKKKFQGVAQRPGKLLWFGLSPRTRPVFALPGNPVSSYTCLHRYVLPALTQAAGAPPAALRLVALAAPVSFKLPLAYFLPVKISSSPTAGLLATPAAVNTSGDFAGLVDTDGFVELPAGQEEFPAGTVVRFWEWV
ncbi:MAG TPA: molybdopterin molybdotransferase MoeA [Opitutaceae bacterium]|jgi:molybdopterin molybdotransferase|nr:molybdopterin molybdotransferase MoeA [Opitutaceae bacterium]